MTETETYDWDSKIGKEADEGGFNILPSGDYSFEVTKLERGRYEGNPEKGSKPCPKAIVTLKVDGGELGDAYVNENIFLNRKNAWKIKAFFVCIGLVAADAKEFVPNWANIVGCTGSCTLLKGQYEKNGNTYDTNDVKKFLPPKAPTATPAEAPAASPVAPAAPSFSYPAGA